MKKLTKIAAVAVITSGMGLAQGATWMSQGYVFCDANTNNLFDAGDVPVANALVIVTNTSGTSSNAAFTSESGAYTVNLPSTNNSYTTFILGSTLAPGTISVNPATANFALSNSYTAAATWFLVRSSNCAAFLPVTDTNVCWLRGGGVIRTSGNKGRPAYTFGVDLAPGCTTQLSDGDENEDNDTNGDQGRLVVVAHDLKLQFKGVVAETVNCGTVTNNPAGSNYTYIEFTGVASVKGIAGNRTDYGLVHFTARFEDVIGGPDRLYLRAYTDAGQNVVLISGQPGTPLTVAPTAISAGEVQIYSSTCDNPPQWWSSEEGKGD